MKTRLNYFLAETLKFRLALIIFLFFFLSAGAADGQALEKRLSISLGDVKIIDFLDTLQHQIGVKFVYSPSAIPVTEEVYIDYQEKALQNILEDVFSSYKITFNEINGQVVLYKNSAADKNEIVKAVTSKAERWLSLTIEGKVVDEKGNGIPGVTILLKGTQLGTTTNLDGNYRLGIPEGHPEAILVFSFIGYKTKEISIQNQTILDIVLEEDLQTLDEVIVNGYQEIRKESFTGTTVTVSGEDLKKSNPTNVLQALQMFDPSFRIDQNNILGSNPNRLPDISLRGNTGLPTAINNEVQDDNLSNLSRASLSVNPNLPTFILDGFQVNIETIFDLNINRIASITILKDAASAAIYGSRAANGVVVITTKAPEEGSLQLTYNVDFNITGPDLSVYNVLNAEEKLEYERLAGVYAAESPHGLSSDELERIYYQKKKNVVSGVDTYWLSEPVETALGSNHSLFLEGGSKALRYGITGRYQNTPGVMKGSERKRYGGEINLSYNLKDRFFFNNILSVTEVKATESPYGRFSDYVTMNPYYPKYDENGEVLQQVDQWQRRDRNEAGADVLLQDMVLNPAYNATLSSFDQQQYTQVINSFSSRWLITKHLEMRALISINKLMSDRELYKSPFSNEYFNYLPENIKEKGQYDYIHSNETALDGNFTLSYNKVISGSHILNATLGGNITTSNISEKGLTANGFTSDRFSNIQFAYRYKENDSPYGNELIDRLVGFIGSINYSYEDRFLLDLAGRMDGSSKFGTDKKFAPFWAAGIGWNLHNEGFLANSNVINRLKIRGTTGITGEVSFPPYMSKTTYAYQDDWYSTGVGAINMGYGNEALKWQRTRNYDLGMEISMFRNSLFFQPGVYYRLTNDLLADIVVPPSVGFTSYKANLGVMENKGFEAMIRANIINGKNNWFVSLFANVAHNQNTIKEISESLKKYNDEVDQMQVDDENIGKPLPRYQEGKSLNTIYGVRSLGIDPETGKEIYLKKDGTITYDYDVKDIVAIGDTSPTVDGNFGTNIAYKNIFFSLNFYTRLGGDMYNQTLVDRVENADSRYNVDQRVLDQRWRQPGDQAFFRDISDNISNKTTQATSRFVQSDNTVELKSASLSYESFGSLAQKLKMQSLRFTVTANDIWRWAPIETERGIDYPFARTVTLSMQARF